MRCVATVLGRISYSSAALLAFSEAAEDTHTASQPAGPMWASMVLMGPR